MSILSAQVTGYYNRLCALESQALFNVEFLPNGVVRLTHGNGTSTEEVSPYLSQLITLVNSVIADGNKVVGGEIEPDGTLKLYRNNSTEIVLGNIMDVANPARVIEIRNDGRIEITLHDGTTTFATTRTIESAVTTSGGGSSTGVGISIMGTPVQFADGTYNQSGTVDIAALSGVTVPLGATHVIIRATVQHDYVANGDQRDPNWTQAIVEGKTIAYAGRRNTTGSEPQFNNIDITSTNTAEQAIALPAGNEVDWSVVSDFDGSTTPSQPERAKIRVLFSVMGFLIGADSQ